MKSSRSRRAAASYRGALQSYLASIRKYEFLSTSGEFRVATQIRQQDEAARRELIESNLRFVVRIAREYRNSGSPIEDLISEGNVGLMEAARRFDPSRGVRFSSYAAWWIRKHMVAALNRTLSQTSSPTPAATEVGSHRPARQRLVSLEAFTQDDADRGILEKLAAEAEDPEAPILQKELADAIRAILPSLPKQERVILTTHYGLDREAPMTLREIGRVLGCSRERVRQIKVRALERTRRLLLARRISRS
jgi:RNA polymerase primary sigma factor